MKEEGSYIVRKSKDGWKNTGWLKNTGCLEEYRMVGGIQDGRRNIGWLKECRMVEGILDG